MHRPSSFRCLGLWKDVTNACTAATGATLMKCQFICSSERACTGNLLSGCERTMDAFRCRMFLLQAEHSKNHLPLTAINRRPNNESLVNPHLEFTLAAMPSTPSRAQSKRASLLKLLGDIENLEANLKVWFFCATHSHCNPSTLFAASHYFAAWARTSCADRNAVPLGIISASRHSGFDCERKFGETRSC